MASDSSHNHLIISTFWVLLLAPMEGGETPSFNSVIAPDCPDMCGNISVHYPFGLKDGCYYVERGGGVKFDNFKLNCNASTTPAMLIYGENLQVLNISVLEGEILMNRYVSYDCYNNQNQSEGNYMDWAYTTTYSISSTKNKLVGTGCDTVAALTGIRYDDVLFNVGCLSTCASLDDVVDGECDGIGCCEVPLPSGASNYSITILNIRERSGLAFNPCSAVFFANDDFKFDKRNLSQDIDFYKNNNLKVPVLFNWAIGTGNCSVAQANASSYLCKENTFCEDPPKEVGYRCKCKKGYTGNPYLLNGCQDIDECMVVNDCEQPEYCINEVGTYHCKCPRGYDGNGTKTDPCVSNTKPWVKTTAITAGVAGGIIILFLAAFILYWKNEKRKLREMRENFFRQNGGLLLHEKLSGKDVDVLKIFTIQDIDIATSNFSENNIIGKGGFGVVYKGILPNEQQVAIKRSLKVDPSQMEQFINEILILSQINNRNIVKLRGCCLETEVPLLVYEFINNGTLYDHIVDPVKASVLTWDIRLKIASEVANVLSYLHYTILTPIIHRDMKSMNILLDKNYTSKVSDFGASRLVPEDEGQLATMVLGTLGYLDPEYMQTGKLTEKSDVYSFGVVLVELLTSKKVVSNDRPEVEKYLAKHFLVKMNEGSLLNILDKSIVSEATIDQIQKVASLAKWCLMLKGEDRPTMKEVFIELETIIRKESHDVKPWDNNDPLQEGGESFYGGLPMFDNTGGGSNTMESYIMKALNGGR